MFYKIFLILIALTMLASSTAALAATADIGAPVVQQFEAFTQTRQGFISFLSWLFPVMLSVATIAAVVSLIIAGFQWMAGSISPPQIEAAQTRIWAAVSGLALALGSWLVINTINPDLVKLRPPTSTLELKCPPEGCPSWGDILFGPPTTFDPTPKPIGDLGGKGVDLRNSPGGQPQIDAIKNLENACPPGKSPEILVTGGGATICMTTEVGQQRSLELSCLGRKRAVEMTVQAGGQRTELPERCKNILN